MVSSRWVAGLSNGKRPVSPSIMINIPIAAKMICGCGKNDELADELINVLKFVPPYVMDTTKMLRKRAGSKSTEIVISLLLPRPPKELATSNPASIVKNLARAKRPMTRRRSPARPNGVYIKNTGMKNAAVVIDTKLTHGHALKIQEL